MRSRGPQFYDAALSRRRSLPGWVKAATRQLGCFRLATSPGFGPEPPNMWTLPMSRAKGARDGRCELA